MLVLKVILVNFKMIQSRSVSFYEGVVVWFEVNLHHMRLQRK